MKHTQSVEDFRTEVTTTKESIIKRVEEKLPEDTVRDIQKNMRKEASMENIVDLLSLRANNLDKKLHKILDQQETQTALLQKLVDAQDSSSTPGQLDATKRRRRK